MTFGVLIFVGLRVGTVARFALARRGRERTNEILSGLRARHFVTSFPVLICVAMTAFALISVPGLDFGWWSAIGGVGNPVTGTTSATEGTTLEWALPMVFLVMLVPGLPLLAEAEERMFRVGAERRTMLQNLWWSMAFGLVHTLIGIPIGVGLALTIGGIYFTSSYLRAYRVEGIHGAVLESTRAHLAYNTWVIGVALVAVGYGAAVALGWIA